MTISNVMVLVVLTLQLVGCHGAAPSAPSAPIPAIPVTLSTSTLVYGYVADTLLRPLAGATVEVLDGPQAGVVVTSIATGEFQLNGTFDDATRFRASKAGLVATTGTLAPKCPTCNGRSLTFYLTVEAAPVSIAGDYTLTLTADPACRALPDDVRTRTYAATISPATSGNTPANSVFWATVSGGSFLQYFNWFQVGVAGADVGIELRGEGPSIIEDMGTVIKDMGTHRYVAFEGRADVRVATSLVSTITAPFDGSIDYCELKSDIGSYYNCSAGATANVPCTSKNHLLTLTRR
jgi:hypothetical protein